jgi:hypothetical protein
MFSRTFFECIPRTTGKPTAKRAGGVAITTTPFNERRLVQEHSRWMG